MRGVSLAAVALFAGAAAACGAPEPAPDPAPAATPAPPEQAGAGGVLRVDPRLDAIVPPDARIEKLAEGFVFGEGPVWDRRASRLLFSDVRANRFTNGPRPAARGRTSTRFTRATSPACARTARTGSRLTRRAGSSCASTATGWSRAWRRTAPAPRWWASMKAGA